MRKALEPLQELIWAAKQAGVWSRVLDSRVAYPNPDGSKELVTLGDAYVRINKETQ